MNRFVTVIMAVLALGLCLTAAGCSRQKEESDRRDSNNTRTEADSDASASSSEPGKYTLDTKVADVISDPVFEGFGRLIFPVDRTIDDDLELKDVGDILVWYNNVNPERTVEIVNYLHDQAISGNQIFYDIYTDEEKAADPDKEDTGLFFFRGELGAKTAIVNAGGGFMYVAAMHDSFPHAMELSEKGYNAFALIYRPGAQTACEDQARNADEMREKLESRPFDLVFLDINMPRKQGLEAMEELKRDYPWTDWCILTGYSYFEYAKKALELGAKGYLLKPPNPDELSDIVEQIRADRERDGKKRRRLFSEAVQKGIYLDDFEGLLSDEEKGYTLYTFFTDSRGEEQRRKICRILYERLEEFMERRRKMTGEEFALFFGSTGELYLVLNGNGDMQLRAFLRKHMDGFEKEARIAGYESSFEKLRELKKTLEFHSALSSLRYFLGSLEMVSVRDLDGDAWIMKKNYFGGQLDKMLAAYTSGDAENLHHELRKMKQEEEAASEEKTILTPEVKSHLEIVLGYPIVSENVRDFTDELWEKTAGRDMGIRTDEELIARICRYVRQNYMADVSLDRLAENFNITPAYLSRFFREKTGEKYIDYVTEVRMEKARELLDTRQYTVKEVSRMVGFLSEKHFSRNFKKYFGENPSQI